MSREKSRAEVYIKSRLKICQLKVKSKKYQIIES